MLKLLAVWVGVALLGGCNIDHSSGGGAGSASADVPLPSGNGTATVSWDASTTTTTGGVLDDLAGYRVYYGTDENDLSQVTDVAVGLQTYVIENLGSGTWYFAVRAVTQLGVESDLSQIVSKTIA